VIRWMAWTIAALLKPKALLVAENLCLRQQMAIPNPSRIFHRGGSVPFDSIYEKLPGRSSCAPHRAADEGHGLL
jgi:hypothetical protein